MSTQKEPDRMISQPASWFRRKLSLVLNRNHGVTADLISQLWKTLDRDANQSANLYAAMSSSLFNYPRQLESTGYPRQQVKQAMELAEHELARVIDRVLEIIKQFGHLEQQRQDNLTARNRPADNSLPHVVILKDAEVIERGVGNDHDEIRDEVA